MNRQPNIHRPANGRQFLTSTRTQGTPSGTKVGRTLSCIPSGTGSVTERLIPPTDRFFTQARLESADSSLLRMKTSNGSPPRRGDCRRSIRASGNGVRCATVTCLTRAGCGASRLPNRNALRNWNLMGAVPNEVIKLPSDQNPFEYACPLSGDSLGHGLPPRALRIVPCIISLWPLPATSFTTIANLEAGVGRWERNAKRLGQGS
jgi:hypothetical protein